MTGRFLEQGPGWTCAQTLLCNSQTKSRGTTRSLQVLNRGAAEGVTDWHQTWCCGQTELIQTHTVKGVLTPNFLGWEVPPRQIHFDLSLQRNISSYQKPLKATLPTWPRTDWTDNHLEQVHCETHWQGSRKGYTSFIPLSITSCCCKNPLSGANQ